ncbi:MAG TPA: hypothetical protein VNE21_04065 [Mycobacteriales bacterium]|nr:hypothetical protein [Mycobacteriales bacterium]
MLSENLSALLLGVVSVVILGVGVLVASRLARAPARTFRVVWPMLVVTTLAIYAVFVYFARMHRGTVH